MCKKTISQFILMCLLSKQILSKEYTCIWYGECKVNQQGHKLNCPYSGPAKELTNTTSLQTLKKWCPHLVNATGTTKLCCDSAQIETIDYNFRMAANFLHRCPTCLHNLFVHFCHTSCDPGQSRFINTTSTEEVKEKENESEITVVTGMQVYVSEEYMKGTYDSCKEVVMPSTGELALDIMCGHWGASGCSPYKWFDYMGDPEANDYVPFRVAYVDVPRNVKEFNGYIPLNPTVKPCNVPINAQTPACSCVDCEASCPAPLATAAQSSPCEVLSISCFVIIMVVIFLLGSTSFLCAVKYGGAIKRKFKKERTAADDVDQGVPSVRPISYRELIGAELDRVLREHFEALGQTCALHPWTTILAAVCIVMTMGYGIFYLNLTTDPVELWASPFSRCRQEKHYFDTNFEPFYRTEQIIIHAVGLNNIIHNTSNGPVEFGPVFNKEFLLKVLDLQEQIEKLGQEDGSGLDKICFAPMASPFTGPVRVPECVVMSVWGYYQSDRYGDSFTQNIYKKEDNVTLTYLNHLMKCLQNKYNPRCLALFGGFIDPAVALGGFLKPGESLTKTAPYEKATAVILTFIVNNYHDKKKLDPALQWEEKFINFMKNWTITEKPPFMDVAFTSERSIEDELHKESQSDVLTIFGSYVLMFVYIALALGRISRCDNLLMDSKITLGLAGVVVVLASVVCSVGFFGFIGVPATLIIFEVIPFLVLAVGVDNIFILVQTHQREPKKEGETTEEHIGRVLGLVGPSLLLTSISESCCFFLGGLSDMPAVKAFALYAAMALFVDFIFQITCFVSILTLDTKRQKNHRLDVCCWLQSPNKEEPPAEDGTLYSFTKKVYAPFLLRPSTRAVVVVLFLGMLCVSISVLPLITIGLDQELSMPPDSHVYKYFKYLNEFLSIGPPVYFVMTGGLDVATTEVQNMICGGRNCNSDSLISQIYRASKTPSTSYIGRPASSWLDDYFDWISAEGCCMVFPNNASFCPHDNPEGDYCELEMDTDTSRPTPATFNRYLSFFLQDNPDAICSKAGHAAYSQAVKYQLDQQKNTVVGATYYMAYHTILKTSSEYYGAIREARVVADNITAMLNTGLRGRSQVNVFPYSVFYVFFEQYLTMWWDTIKSISISLGAVFLVTVALMALDFVLSFIIITTITMIIVNVGGLMYFWSISLNAVSLVNLVMAIGISVEFCSHIVHAFSVSMRESRVKRVEEALVNTGTSVFSGITLTKAGGIIVLGFANSQIFRVFYFRMYVGIVLFGALHGLIFLPVILSYCGSSMNRRKHWLCKREEQRTSLDGELRGGGGGGGQDGVSERGRAAVGGEGHALDEVKRA